MKKPVHSQEEVLKTIILTGIIAGLTFTLLVIATIPFIGGKNSRLFFPTFKAISEPSNAATARLACTSWENVKINNCTLAEWNKGEMANTVCNIIKPLRVSASLNSEGANQYRYKLVPLASDCVKENLTAQPWMSFRSPRNMSVSVPQQATGQFVSGAKLCVQYRRNATTATSAMSPICEASIRFKASQQNTYEAMPF